MRELGLGVRLDGFRVAFRFRFRFRVRVMFSLLSEHARVGPRTTRVHGRGHIEGTYRGNIERG